MIALLAKSLLVLFFLTASGMFSFAFGYFTSLPKEGQRIPMSEIARDGFYGSQL
jgi:hypothetical protein